MSTPVRIRKPETEEILVALRALDTTSRRIMAHDKIEFKCHSCENAGSKDLSEAKKSFKKHGFGFQCQSCLQYKLDNRGDKWLQGIRAAAQTPEHKARAVANSLKSRKKYFEPDIVQTLRAAGVSYIGDLSSASNFITVTWPDGASRSVRIRDFMSNGLERPKRALACNV